MIKLFIKKHISKLTKEDIIYFSKKNDIYLDSNDIDIIFKYIKNSYENILYNPDKTITDIDKYMSDNCKDKVKSLYLLYYNKYKHYL